LIWAQSANLVSKIEQERRLTARFVHPFTLFDRCKDDRLRDMKSAASGVSGYGSVGI
jgi:hypothetical protein